MDHTMFCSHSCQDTSIKKDVIHKRSTCFKRNPYPPVLVSPVGDQVADRYCSGISRALCTEGLCTTLIDLL